MACKEGLDMLIVTWHITKESDPDSSVSGKITVNFRMNKMKYFTMLKVKFICMTFSLSLSFKTCVLNKAFKIYFFFIF